MATKSKQSKINVGTLKITATSNVDTEPFELTRSKIYDPVPGVQPRNVTLAETPFFTADKLYPVSLLEKKTYTELLHIFFNKSEFIRVVINEEQNKQATNAKPIVNPGSDNSQTKYEYANTNIKTMLRLLFPTSYPTKNNITSSFEKYLKKTSSANIDVKLRDIKSMFFSSPITTEGRHEYSYIKTGPGIFTITEVSWLDDVFNESSYRELMDKLIEYNDWVETQRDVVEKDITDSTTKLLEGLKKTEKSKPSSSGLTKTEPNAIEPLGISQEDISNIEKEKRSYNPDDMKETISNLIDSFVQIDGKDIGDPNIDVSKMTIYKTAKDKMIDLFLKKHVIGSTNPPISQMTQLFDLFDFTSDESVIPKLGETDIENGIDALSNQESSGLLKSVLIEIAKRNNKVISEQDIDTIRTSVALQDLFKQFIKTNSAKIVSIIGGTSSFAGLSNGGKTKSILKIILTDIYTELVSSQNRFSSNLLMLYDGYNHREEHKLNEQNINILLLLPNLNNRDRLENMRDFFTNNPFSPSISFLTMKGSKAPPPPNDTLEHITSNARDQLTKLKRQIYNDVITKYNRFRQISDNKELYASYLKIDADISTMVENIKKLNDIANRAEGDPSPSTEDILNITEQIKSAFDKLGSSNVSILQSIGSKLKKIIRLSNQIKFLTQIQSELFGEHKGIFVNYDKDLDKTNAFNMLFLEELKNDKYAYFLNTIAFIKDKFLKNGVKSLNPELQTLLDDYFSNKNDNLNTQLLEPIKSLLNEGTTPNTFGNQWNVSVVSTKSSTTNETGYHVSLYFDMIEGELNSENKKDIQCDYQDEKLTTMLEQLTANRSMLGPEKTTVFSIKKTQQKNKEEEDQKQKEIAISSIPKRKETEFPIADPVQPGNLSENIPVATNARYLGGKTMNYRNKKRGRRTHKKYK